MRLDFSAAVRQIYHDAAYQKQPLSESLVWQAGLTIERLYPPQHVLDAFRILASLNLLNAAVKTFWGRRLVSYGYIKGMAACMLVCVVGRGIRDVRVYYDAADCIAYFRVLGVQVSFHHIPHYQEVHHLLADSDLPFQQWDGLRLQLMPVELYRMGCPDDIAPTRGELNRLRKQMLHFRKPDLDYLWRRPAVNLPMQLLGWETAEPSCRPVPASGLVSLDVALHFNIWNASQFELYRRKDHRPFRAMRYDGTNYRQLMTFLVGDLPNIPWRSKRKLQVGKLYHLSPKRHVLSLSPSQVVVALTQNSYLQSSSPRRLYNLCVTYEIALFLTYHYPRLRFVSTLNINRRCVRRRYFSYRSLLHLPPNSLSRQLKVWMAYDPQQLLAGFSTDTLPPSLLADYLARPDYYLEFDVLRHQGLMGLKAYGRHHLLNTCYRNIRINNYHASVQSADGKWAIYSLGEECFKTGFVYDRIWFDSFASIVYGLRDDIHVDVICKFFPNRRAI